MSIRRNTLEPLDGSTLGKENDVTSIVVLGTDALFYRKVGVATFFGEPLQCSPSLFDKNDR